MLPDTVTDIGFDPVAIYPLCLSFPVALSTVYIETVLLLAFVTYANLGTRMVAVAGAAPFPPPHALKRLSDNTDKIRKLCMMDRFAKLFSMPL